MMNSIDAARSTLLDALVDRRQEIYTRITQINEHVQSLVSENRDIDAELVAVNDEIGQLEKQLGIVPPAPRNGTQRVARTIKKAAAKKPAPTVGGFECGVDGCTVRRPTERGIKNHRAQDKRHKTVAPAAAPAVLEVSADVNIPRPAVDPQSYQHWCETCLDDGVYAGFVGQALLTEHIRIIHPRRMTGLSSNEQKLRKLGTPD